MKFSSTILPLLLPLLTSSTPINFQPSLSKRACAPLDLVYARGTTESQSNFGLIGTPLVNAVQSAVPGATAYNVVYPADDNFGTSPQVGARDMLAHITSTAAACPGTKFALAGWSQGAMVVHDIMGSIPAGLQSKIASIAVFGDPFRLSETTFPIDNQANVIKFCNTGDPICENGSNIAAHLQYASNGDVQNAATFIAARA